MAPGEGWKDPSAQGVHEERPASGEKRPGGQRAQTVVLPNSENDPARQLSHWLDNGDKNVPEEQETQAVAPRTENSPVGHEVHEVAKYSVENVPGPHQEH